MFDRPPRRHYLLALLSAAGAALVAACKSGPSVDVSSPQTPVPAPLGTPEPISIGPIAVAHTLLACIGARFGLAMAQPFNAGESQA